MTQVLIIEDGQEYSALFQRYLTEGFTFTRAGSFVPDGSGKLINAAGFTLMGYDASNGIPTATTNGFQGLIPVNLSQNELNATPSTKGGLSVNLPANATAVVAANLPSANAASAQFTAKSSMEVYDNLGGQVLLDVYFTKTGADTWEVAVYNKADAATGGGFPYTSAALATQTLTFNPTTGEFATGDTADSWAHQREDGSWLLDGLIPAPELKDRLELRTLPEEERERYQALSGMLMLMLGRMPQTGDTVTWENWRFEVIDMDGKRVDKVLATPIQIAAAPDDGPAQSDPA